MNIVEKATKVIDISVPISERLPTWPGDPAVSKIALTDMSEGDQSNVSGLALTSHTGTHIDAPRHFIEDGAPVGMLPLDSMVGICQVIDIDKTLGEITADDIAPCLPLTAQRVLFRTRNSHMWNDTAFFSDYISLGLDAAHLLIGAGVKLVGIDYLSIEAFKNSEYPVHKALLEAGVVILEGLDLRGVEPGTYRLTALPLLIADGDGAPARAFLESLTP